MEEVAQVVGIVATVVALYKVFMEVVVFRSSKRRDEYQFSKQFVADLSKTDIHRLTLEKGFLALTGKIYPVEEIQVILSGNEPSLSINERSDAAGFIKFDRKEKRYRWKGRYEKPIVRTCAVAWYYIWYVILAMVGIVPVFMKGIASSLDEVPIVAFSGSLILVAIMCLISAEKYKSARRFMEKFGSEA
ncbi:hypothetical protein [Marinobacter adhaerens]|jgi:hypothetical protein|uniref:hypothetical protein n=1 Tax=Marinobacter adhaerens TaxID=1033846 RepID=UPI001C5711B6|nr:hypothetical protein [Marinobacter adhaerens]MBW3227744.1 hypothetical protein [Marinobacter adhaerens]